MIAFCLRISPSSVSPEPRPVTGSTGTFKRQARIALEVVVFPKTYEMYPNISKGDLLKVRGTVERRLDQYQIIVENEIDDTIISGYKIYADGSSIDFSINKLIANYKSQF